MPVSFRLLSRYFSVELAVLIPLAVSFFEQALEADGKAKGIVEQSMLCAVIEQLFLQREFLFAGPR